jgi:argininosuccinate synthase
MAKRVVLAYSGGLDTSVAVRWIREVGARRSWPSRSTWASGPTTVGHDRARALRPAIEGKWSARAGFADDFLVPAIRQALYEQVPLVSALIWPVSRHRARAQFSAGAVAHAARVGS